MEAILIFLLSVVFFSIETLVRAYITDSDAESTRAFKSEFEQGSLDQKLVVLFKWDAVPQVKITRSVILQVALVVFTLFAMTSSYSSVGFGVGLSVLLQMLFDQIQLLRKNKDISIWFWQIKTQISQDSQNMYVGTMIIVFLILSMMIF